VKPRFRAWLPAAVWAAVLFFASSRETLGVDLSGGLDKLAHFGAYFVLGALLAHATTRLGETPLLAVAIGVAYGAVDEIHQHFVPGRTSDVFDWVADTAGVICGVLIFLLVFTRNAPNELSAGSAESRTT